MNVGAPTDTASAEWLPIRRDGKLLFEYDPDAGRIRLRRWGQTFVVDLAQVGERPWREEQQLTPH